MISSEIAAQNPLPANAQSNLRIRKYPVAPDTLVLDSLSIIPHTLGVQGVPPSDYRFDPVTGGIIWLLKPQKDSVLISYRVFPFRLNPSLQRISFDSVMNNFFVTPFEFNDSRYNNQKGIFDFGNLNYNGSFGRGISFGNSQDAVVNSSLNLQLNGMLGDSVEVAAAITDNNIPIQPDGTTQQLNEFDQVFLQFRKKSWQLSLGDIDLRQNKNYFLNFYKRLQGISFETKNRISNSVESNTLLSGSIAKGKFTRNIFQGLEGNQGPYRLTGANNEFFFIVLAGTERVFVDGELLQRGEDQDYVINYNTAELTFTPKRMITKDSRIQVEFEYADRNYLNANLYIAEDLAINDKWKIRLAAFNNSDAKNSQINQVLSNDQKFFLSQVGDSIQHAFYPTAALDSFAANKILYAKIYYNNGVDSFYQYSTNPDSAHYSLSFVDVGAGKGNYIPDFNGANGKVYKFIPPVGNVLQGQYEPVAILVTPKKQQVVTLGVDYNASENTVIKTDFALSNYDVNTFSGINDGDDLGVAAKILLSNTRHLHAAPGQKLDWVNTVNYEYVQAKFKPIERLRNVEFSRDWGLTFNQQPADENIIRVSSELRREQRHALAYQFVNYRRGDQYSGFQNALVHTIHDKGWTVNNRFMITQFNTASDRGSFLRPMVDFSKQLSTMKNWRVGFNYSLEHNAARYKSNDTLTPLSFSFDTYSIYMKSDESRANKFGITFFTRSDKYPVGKEFIRGDRSLNLNLQTELTKSKAHQFYFNTTFRKLVVKDSMVSKQQEDETILGRAEYRINEWNGFLTGNVLYELGAGQEQKRDYAYLEVPAGQGVYTWNDYDSNGVQSLNEFEIALFPDQARYIRIFTPTNEFVKANYTTFNYSFGLDPRTLFSSGDTKGMGKFISRFNFQSSLQISKKSLSKGSFEFNPFKYGLNDTALITLNTVLLNTISFNRFSSKWGLDLSSLQNSGKSLLTYGYESRKVKDLTLKFRVNLSRSITFETSARKGTNELYTPSFENRNYRLNIYSIEPKISLVRGTRFRVVTGYKMDQKKNNPAFGGEKSVSNALNVETKYNILQNTAIGGRFTMNNIDYKTGTSTGSNTTVGYIMLDGLLPGKNYIWSLTLTKRLLNNVELNLQYDGRKAASSRSVHVGRASITALF